MDFYIDPEFQARLPAQSDDERKRLAAKIKREGCLEGAIVVAVIHGDRRILLDGHNTIAICKELDVKTTKPRIVHFDNREQALEWMIDNQLARRNLSDLHRAYFIGKKYLTEKNEHGGDRKSSPHCEDLIRKTSEKVAEETGVSKATVERNAEFAAAVDKIGQEKGPEAVKQILNGEAGTKKQIVDSVKVILCQSCQRKQRVGQELPPNCLACRDERQKSLPREPGVEPPEPPKKRTPASERNGAVLFDWKGFENDFGKVVRSVDAAANAYPHAKKSQEIKECRDYLEEFLKSWKAFKKVAEKSK